MFSLSDLRETKVYQEALEEGREEGKEEGNTIFQKVCHTW
jgi:predicted transposase YdaD